MNLRLKTGQKPGDISKPEKQDMLEGRHPDKKRAKSFKKMVRTGERAVLKQRTRKIIEDS
jgi:hypothetical protein